MSALATDDVEIGTEPRIARGRRERLSPDLEGVILEIAASERALDDVLERADRLHASNIAHDPRSCLVCFTSR